MDNENQRQNELNSIIEKLISQRQLPSAERIRTLEQFQITASQDICYIMLELLKTETDLNVVIHICNALARLRNPDAVMSVVDLALGNREVEGKDDPLKENADGFFKVRVAAVKALGKLRSEKAVVPLMYILNNKDENYRIRLVAAESLGSIGDTYALNPLINLVLDEKESSVYVRESAAKALGMLGDVRAIKPLVKILESKRGILSKFSFLKERVIETIGKISASPDTDTIKALKESLMDEVPSVRLSAVEALASMGDESLIKVLIPAVYDEDEDVARTAVRGIYSLGGYLELNKLLEDDRLAGWSRDEIETVFEEE